MKKKGKGKRGREKKRKKNNYFLLLPNKGSFLRFTPLNFTLKNHKIKINKNPTIAQPIIFLFEFTSSFTQLEIQQLASFVEIVLFAQICPEEQTFPLISAQVLDRILVDIRMQVPLFWQSYPDEQFPQFVRFPQTVLLPH
jgi:hypothetical protein